VAELPWLWQMQRQGREGLQFIRRAIDRAPEDHSRTQARLLCGVALVADTAGPLDLEYDAAQRARELAEELGDAQLRSLCLALAAVGRFYTDFDDACELAVESARHGDAFVVDASAALRGIVAHLRDAHGEAQRLLSDSAASLTARGERGVASSALAFLSGSALMTGDLVRARGLAERAIAIASPLADHLRIGMGRAALALALGAGGELEAGFTALAPVRALVGEVFLPEVGRALGVLHLWGGEYAKAVERLREEAASSDGGRPTYLAIRALPPLAAALRLAGDDEAAAGTAARGAALARERGMPGVLADCLDEQGHLREDVELHHEALAIRAEHGLRPGMVRSLEALAAYGAPDHAARLAAAAARARAEMGWPTDPAGSGTDAVGLEEAVAYASRARGPRRRAEGGWGSLTPAELEVVRLAVDGLSNPEIGARLFMSRSTVKTHLSHVYAKLGIANRTELAARAAGNLQA
jgi:DNA-binding CsgD family transcriptional regulator